MPKGESLLNMKSWKLEWKAPWSMCVALSIFLQKRGNNSDIKIFGLSPFSAPIPHIDLNNCLKSQFNPLSRKKVIWKLFESVTKKVWWTDRQTDGGKKKGIPTCLPCQRQLVLDQYLNECCLSSNCHLSEILLILMAEPDKMPLHTLLKIRQAPG